MRYSPLMSLEGVVYPIVTLSLWVSLFIELKSFNIALMTSTSRHDQNKHFFTPMAKHWLPSPLLMLLAGAGAAGWCWFCWLVLVLCWCCWLLGCCVAGCRLRSAGCWLAARTDKHTMSLIFFTGYRFLAAPYRFPTKPQKPHCHEMPFLNVDDHNFDPDSYANV